MPVFSNEQIRMGISEGHIACHPFVPAHLNAHSLTLTLGYNYYRVERAKERTIFNPFDAEDVERYFDGPYKALACEAWSRLNGLAMPKNIPAQHPVISLSPGERILAHSHEFLGTDASVAFEMRAYADWSRSGLHVSALPGSTPNRIVLEIINLNQRETVLLPVGEPIATAVFSSTTDAAPAPLTDMDNVIRIWSPDMLLPKTYDRQRSLPPKIEGVQYE